MFVDVERCLVVVVVVVNLAVSVSREGHPFDVFVELIVPAREPFCSFECVRHVGFALIVTEVYRAWATGHSDVADYFRVFGRTDANEKPFSVDVDGQGFRCRAVIGEDYPVYSAEGR